MNAKAYKQTFCEQNYCLVIFKICNRQLIYDTLCSSNIDHKRGIIQHKSVIYCIINRYGIKGLTISYNKTY